MDMAKEQEENQVDLPDIVSEQDLEPQNQEENDEKVPKHLEHLEVNFDDAQTPTYNEKLPPPNYDPEDDGVVQGQPTVTNYDPDGDDGVVQTPYS